MCFLRMLLHEDTMARLPPHDDTIGALQARHTIKIRLDNRKNTQKELKRKGAAAGRLCARRVHPRHTMRKRWIRNVSP